MTCRDIQTIAVLSDATQRIDISDIKLWVNAIHEHVHCNVDEVNVSGALAVAEQRAFHAVSACHDAELCCSCCCTSVIVGVQ